MKPGKLRCEKAGGINVDVKGPAWVQWRCHCWRCDPGACPLPPGHVHRGGREVLPGRAGSGARPFAQPGNHLPGSQTREVRAAQRWGTESLISPKPVASKCCCLLAQSRTMSLGQPDGRWQCQQRGSRSSDQQLGPGLLWR